ncbi:Carboxypeptidase C [Nostoc flagelliforme CCNUN1]|uniref:Carboxypeptidase C n=1 Tax=Nostoc flagelliforme CCNUN1 TaxID=2038116 RepID=A0A2K8SSL5_9NOSO|nr:Carboxypeptidase C [Nostoc flagelliforme CCNUN1]
MYLIAVRQSLKYSNTTSEYLNTTSEYLKTTLKYLKTTLKYLNTTLKYLNTTLKYLNTTLKYLKTTLKYLKTTLKYLNTTLKYFNTTSRYLFLRYKVGEPLRPCGFPTCTPTGKQATLLAFLQGSKWRLRNVARSPQGNPTLSRLCWKTLRGCLKSRKVYYKPRFHSSPRWRQPAVRQAERAFETPIPSLRDAART